MRIAVTKSRVAWTGIAWTHNEAFKNASEGLVVAVTFEGKTYSDIYFGLRCSWLISSQTHCLRTSNDTG